ncbi:MAG: hypothetical protein IJH60_00255, partial [Eubacterium sp.]|nr:hypothetical protein [Eubacterium sp.]
NWSLRKTILINSVKKVFHYVDEDEGGKSLLDVIFSLFKKKEVNPINEEKCESFAAVLYYIHILGDQLDSDEYDESFSIAPFIANGNSKVCIVDEMKSHFSILFASQTSSADYKGLMRGIKKYKKMAEEYMDPKITPGGIYLSENYERFRENCEEEYLKMLMDYVPNLLREEDFFTNIFKDF